MKRSSSIPSALTLTFALAGCVRQPQKPPGPPMAPDPWPEAVAATDEASSHASGALREVDVEMAKAEPLCERSSRTGEVIRRGRQISVVVESAWSVKDRLLVVETEGTDVRTTLLDTKTRRAIASVPGGTRALPTLGLVAVASPRPAVLHVDSGRLIAPRAVLPGGAFARNATIVAHPEGDYLWVVADDGSGNAFGAIWSDPTDPVVELDVPLPVPAPSSGDEIYYLTRWTNGIDPSETRRRRSSSCGPRRARARSRRA